MLAHTPSPGFCELYATPKRKLGYLGAPLGDGRYPRICEQVVVLKVQSLEAFKVGANGEGARVGHLQAGGVGVVVASEEGEGVSRINEKEPGKKSSP